MIATLLIVLGLLIVLCALGGAAGWAFRRSVHLSNHALHKLDRAIPFPKATRRSIRKLW